MNANMDGARLVGDHYKDDWRTSSSTWRIWIPFWGWSQQSSYTWTEVSSAARCRPLLTDRRLLWSLVTNLTDYCWFYHYLYLRGVFTSFVTLSCLPLGRATKDGTQRVGHCRQVPRTNSVLSSSHEAQCLHWFSSSSQYILKEMRKTSTLGKQPAPVLQNA